MKNNSLKQVMVLERSSENLKIIQDDDNGNFILEGIFAQFGIVNNNDRIYEESEYLPHMDYLNKKIQKGSLMGELDHPEKFDISLSKVSHRIEKLEFNKDKREIFGRVRLLDTPSGKIAQELVRAGVPISISSRAAGLVESNKKVKIKKIFTYDLVADPGFENAVLNRINESLGITNEYISIYEIENSETITENMEPTESTSKIQQNNITYVTANELNNYSIRVKEEIESIGEKVNKLKENTELSAEISQLKESMNKMTKYLDYLAGTSDQTIQYAEYVAERLDKITDYTNYLAKTVDESIAYSENIAEKVDTNIKYSDYLKEQIGNGIKYSEYIKECVEKSVNYSEYIAEKADQTLDQSIKYSEYIGEKLSQTISYADYLAESTNKTIAYTEYIAEQTQAVADYTEYSLNESKTGTTPQTSKSKLDYNSLPSKVDQLIESVKKQKVETVNENLNYGFVKLLNEAKAAEFNLLDETKKQKVASALFNKSANTPEEIQAIWESALHPRSEKWLDEAPEQYKKVWESLDESQKRTLIAQSRSYKLESPYQINNFWETRTSNLLTPLTNKLNESKTAAPLFSPLGYSDEYVKEIGNRLGKLPRR